MTRRKTQYVRALIFLFAAAVAPHLTVAQAIPYARSFAKPKDQVVQGLQELQAYSGQKLPLLDGFVGATAKPLSQYERGFYQYAIEILPGESGGAIVRLSAKITAWYADRDVAKSGYEVLASNGRLELDLLDRLEEKLTGKAVNSPVASHSFAQAPQPKLDLSGVPGASLPSAPVATPARTPDEVAMLRAQREAKEKHLQQLTSELQSLKEIQRGQAHPQNLVVVKKTSTPVYAKSGEGARVLFMASAKDEFEFLDGEGEWIHVGISGDSRGYLKRNELELPERIAAKLTAAAPPAPEEKFPGFRIEREETSAFPGDWAPMRGKSTKIYTVQIVSQVAKEIGPAARLNYSLVLFQKAAKENASGDPAPEGVAVIFDSADGGIAGATLADVQKLASGAITRDVFWSSSYLDPPESFHPVTHP